MEFENEIDALMEKIGRELVKERGRPKERVAFDAAVNFHVGAKRCAEPHPTGKEGQVQTPAAPMICCYAFACELYLKSILDEQKARGHDLEKLFRRLSANQQDAIAHEYEELTGRSKPKFRQDVKEFGNAFVDWRYLHEKGKVKLAVHRLALFALALYRQARRTHPDWEIEQHTHEVIEGALPEEVVGQISLGGGLHVRAVVKR